MNCLRRSSILLLTGFACVVGFFQATGAQSAPQGRLILKADAVVTVNGTSAISGATVFSDSTVTTAKGSSAVVSLGKLGRVEVLPESSLKLSFTESGVTGMLDQGRVRLSTSSGVNASVTTADGSVVAIDKRTEFLVDVTCGNTFVSVRKGRVELRAGSTVKQIAAGGQDTAGTARPGCTNEETND